MALGERHIAIEVNQHARQRGRLSSRIAALRPSPSDAERSQRSQNAAAECVRFNHVDKAYDPRTLVIRDLNLVVQPGEFLTLLGPSGSGKTTTLMMLAGFEHPTGGEILLEGRPISREPSYRRNFGMVFQDYALFPHMTVFENVSFPLQVRRMLASEINRRTKDMLAVVKLEGFEDRLPGHTLRRSTAACCPRPRPCLRATARADGRAARCIGQATARAASNSKSSISKTCSVSPSST